MSSVDLAGNGPGLVRAHSDITAGWTEAVLRGSGALEDGVSVTGVTTERIAEGVGLLSVIQRVRPTYSGPTSAPASLVVKYPTDDAAQRFTADALAFYVREIVFYRDFAAGAPFRTARCHAHGIAGDSTDFTVVLEDIGGLRPLNQLEGIGLADATVLIGKLADFHAMWWESPRIPAMQEHFRPISNEIYDLVLPSLWDAGWAAVLEHTPEIVPAELAHVGGLWSQKTSWMLAQMMAPMTVLHGDYRADNLMFDGAEPVVLDFQIVGTGSGVYDLGYFVSQSIASEVRSGRDDELFTAYLGRLASHGIDVDRDEAWRQYRIATAFCLIYSVTNYPQYPTMNDRGRALLRDMLSRSLRAVADIDALTVID